MTSPNTRDDASATPPSTVTGDVVFPLERKSQIDVLVVSIIFIVLPTVAVALRLLARYVAHRKVDASDYCIIAACVLANALQAVAIVLVFEGGAGFHFTEIMEKYGPKPIEKFLRILIPVQLLWAVSLSLVKASILLMYTKIFTMRSMVITSYVTGGFIIAWALATVLSGFLICRPFALNWDQTLDGTCGDQVLSYTITGSLNLVTDVVVFLLPMPYLWGLQLKLYKKIVLIITFGMGLFTIIISTMRLVSLQELDYNDITYNIPHALIFGALEPSVGIVLSCLPLLRPLLGRSKYSSDGTAGYSGSHDLPSNPVRSGNALKSNGFAELDDDSSQYRLRPLGPKHTVSIGNKTTDRSSDVSDEQSLNNEEDRSGIVVKQHWSVSQT